MNKLEWSVGDYISSIKDQPPSLELPAFDYSAGPSARTKESKSPIEFFQLMLTLEIVEAIVQQSKRFASKKTKQESIIKKIVAHYAPNMMYAY